MSVSLVQCRPHHDNEPTEVEVDESFFVILFLLAICVDVSCFLSLLILLINCKTCCLNVTVLLRDSSEYYSIIYVANAFTTNLETCVVNINFLMKWDFSELEYVVHFVMIQHS